MAGGSIEDFTSLAAGEYTIIEDDPAATGYRLKYIQCSVSTGNSNDFISFFGKPTATRSVTVDLEARRARALHVCQREDPG